MRVGPFTSEAVLITDADTAVPVSINRNGLRTIAVGTGDSGLLRLPYLTNNQDVEKGDLLVSSGLGGVFPAGYPVGRITEIRLRPDQSFAEIMAEPASALDRDREVLLVWNAADEAPHANEAGELTRRRGPEPREGEVTDASMAEREHSLFLPALSLVLTLSLSLVPLPHAISSFRPDWSRSCCSTGRSPRRAASAC